MATRTPSFRSALTAVVRISHFSNTIHTKVSSLTDFIRHWNVDDSELGSVLPKSEFDDTDVVSSHLVTETTSELWNLVKETVTKRINSQPRYEYDYEKFNSQSSAIFEALCRPKPPVLTEQIPELLAVHPVSHKYNKTIETLCLKAVDWDRNDVNCRLVETDMSEVVWNLVKGIVTTAETPNTPMSVFSKQMAMYDYDLLLAVHPVSHKYNKTIESLCLKAVDWGRDDVNCRLVETDMSEEVWNLVKGIVTTAETPNTPMPIFSKQMAAMYDYDLLLAVHPVSHKYNKTIESLCLKAVDWGRDDVNCRLVETDMSEQVWNLVKGIVTTAETPNTPMSIYSKQMAPMYDYDFKALCRPKPHVITDEFPKVVDLLVIQPNCCNYTKVMNECLCLKAAEWDLEDVSRRFESRVKDKSPTAYDTRMTQAAAEVVRICESFGIKPDVFAYSYNGVIRSIAGQEGNVFAYTKKHEMNKAVKLMDVKPKPLKKRRESGKTKLHGEDQNILIVHDNDLGLSHSIAYQRGDGTNITATSLYTKDQVKSMFDNAEYNINSFEDLGGTVYFNVGALSILSDSRICGQLYNQIIYNHPYLPLFQKGCDADMIAKNKIYIGLFFEKSSQLIDDEGSIILTIKANEPYDQLDIRGLANSHNLTVKTQISFPKKDYPYYMDKQSPNQVSSTFIIVKQPIKQANA